MKKEHQSLIRFVKKVFELSEISTDVFDSEYIDMFDLDEEIKKYSDTIGEKISKADEETLAKKAVEISKEVGINDIWKYALIFNSFYEFTDLVDDSIVEDAIKVLYEKIPILAPSWQDAVTLLSEGLKEKSASPGFMWNGLSREQNEDVEEYVNGCFFLGIEASINTQFIDCDDSADGIDAWILGYGDCYEHGGPVGDIIEPLADEGYWYNGQILNNMINLLSSLHEMDVEEFHTDDGTNWKDAADKLKMNTL
jgi:hypothetical protein